MKNILIISCLIGAVTAKNWVFPPGFKLGVATASYQIEGGWNASGKSENIWDRLTHTKPSLIKDHSTGDVACDSYHLWQTDINILADLKVDFYRFSLSWSRILPDPFPNKINPDGVRYYNNIINALLTKKIQPMVTIYHWDLPQTLQDLGGWTNPLTASYFEDYARVVFSLFGDRVKTWITINEPASICIDTYSYGNGAPDAISSGIGDYLCGKTILLAHAKAYRLYQREFKAKQGGIVGITLDSGWSEPKTKTTGDLNAAERNMQFRFGWWAHPIFSKDGDYPQVMKDRIGNMSRLENYTSSRLPPLSNQEISLIRGSFDFMGLNHYHTYLVSEEKFPLKAPTSFDKDKGAKEEIDASWQPQPTPITPWGLRKLLNWVKNRFGNPMVLITENGFPDQGGLQDTNRLTFIKEYMKAVIDAIYQDACNVTAYTVWSVMDNMEWRSGYMIKYGIYQVNFTSPNRTRTAKMSASFYKYVIKTKSIPDKEM